MCSIRFPCISLSWWHKMRLWSQVHRWDSARFARSHDKSPQKMFFSLQILELRTTPTTIIITTADFFFWSFPCPFHFFGSMRVLVILVYASQICKRQINLRKTSHFTSTPCRDTGTTRADRRIKWITVSLLPIFLGLSSVMCSIFASLSVTVVRGAVLLFGMVWRFRGKR